MISDRSRCGLCSRSDAASTSQVSVTQAGRHTSRIATPTASLRLPVAPRPLLLPLLHQERTGSGPRCCMAWGQTARCSCSPRQNGVQRDGSDFVLVPTPQGSSFAHLHPPPEEFPPHSPPLLSAPPFLSHTHVQLPSVIFVSKENLIQSISSASLPQCPPH